MFVIEINNLIRNHTLVVIQFNIEKIFLFQ